MKILLIDDEAEVVAFLYDYLSEQGHSVDRAYDGKSGLKLLQENDYDLIFSDHNMPELSGLELAKYVKQNNVRAKIIIITGYPNINEFFAKALGADAYIRKPFRFEALDEIVQRYAPTQ